MSHPFFAVTPQLGLKVHFEYLIAQVIICTHVIEKHEIKANALCHKFLHLATALFKALRALT